ncbi:efflux RND transporter periplasmic adaptor subunit [Gilvimarinus agarilyticus]|uniref:efflux RND transporter periplasmic adaptor subunit n=1 Tax=Gilvimarinus agarilyticus TaxID=679259 RepID=UPI000A007F77|nr:efflux RND transporter periplasmic adaptor subunit [Gilvimarinus agarilyticus]
MTRISGAGGSAPTTRPLADTLNPWKVSMKAMSVLLLGAVLVLSACEKAPAEQPVSKSARPAKIVQAHSARLNAMRSFPGVTEATRHSDLAFRVGGQLESLPAKPGMRFEQGDVLAQLDQAVYRNNLADRQAKYDLAKSQFDKISSLLAQNYTSDSAVEEAEANVRATKAALDDARDNLKYTTLKAPFTGVIAHVGVENHQTVAANQVILELQSVDTLDVRYSVPESLLGQIKPTVDPRDICAQVRFNAYPSRRYEACFKEYETKPDPVTRSYSVVHTMAKNQDFPVLPGMAVTVDLDLTAFLAGENITGVLVPIEAVFEQDGQAYVWRVDSERNVHKVPVNVGQVQGDYLYLLDGLSAGDNVVAAGVSYLHEGDKVRALVKERGI